VTSIHFFNFCARPVPCPPPVGRYAGDINILSFSFRLPPDAPHRFFILLLSPRAGHFGVSVRWTGLCRRFVHRAVDPLFLFLQELPGLPRPLDPAILKSPIQRMLRFMFFFFLFYLFFFFVLVFILLSFFSQLLSRDPRLYAFPPPPHPQVFPTPSRKRRFL